VQPPQFGFANYNDTPSELEEDTMTTRSNAPQGISRRTFLKAGAAMSAAAPLWSISRSAMAAPEFSYKLATGQDPTHPVNIRAQEAINQIREATKGRLDIKLFPQNQLGSDTDLLSQVRNGGVEFFNQASSILATLTPAAGIVNTGFAFKDYDAVWKAMDGDLGNYVRAQITKSGIVSVSKVWDNGFRQISSSTKALRTPADLKGFKIRVPQAPMLTSLFKALDAGPAPINFNELYSADHRYRQALRSAEVHQPHVACVGRLLDSRQPCGMGTPARRYPRDRHARIRKGRDAATRGHRQAEPVVTRRPEGQGHYLCRCRSHGFPWCAGQDELLSRLESQIRRRGVGLA
jgi:hypothetical protein